MLNIDYYTYHAIINENTILLKDFSSQIEKGSNIVNVLCVVKNGAYYIERFIKYHKELGVDTLTFLDNGSNDDTIKIASRFDCVRIFTNTLPYKKYWHHFKRFMFEEYGRNCWNLILDIDEFFEGPFNKQISLKELVRYNEENNYSAVVTHMVDLIPKENILSVNRNQDFLKNHIYYSNDNLKIKDYNTIIKSNKIHNTQINFYTNGWRDMIFGVGEIMLTKHSFIKGDEKLKYTHDHFVENASVADYTCILKHYKFHNGFKKYVEDSVNEENHYNNSVEYKLYQKKIAENAELNFFDTKMFNILNKLKLIENNLIQVNPGFLLYFSKNEKLSSIFHQIVRKNNLLQNRNIEKISTLENEVERLNQHISELNQHISEIKKSWTWKIARSMTKFLGKFFLKE